MSRKVTVRNHSRKTKSGKKTNVKQHSRKIKNRSVPYKIDEIIAKKYKEKEIEDFDHQLENDFNGFTKEEIMRILETNNKKPELMKFANGLELIRFDHENKIKLVMLDKCNTEWHTIEDFEDWFLSMWEDEAVDLVKLEEPDIWKDEIGEGSVLYHATQPEYVDSILKNGLEIAGKTRGTANKWVGAAVFTSWNKDSIDAYGSSVFEIDVGKMKEDGVTPDLEEEPTVMEAKAKRKIAGMFDFYNYDDDLGMASGGISEETVIVHGNIPAKYLKLIKE